MWGKRATQGDREKKKKKKKKLAGPVTCFICFKLPITEMLN